LKEVELFSDGSSLGNPGFRGYATILRYKDKERVFKKAFENVTNNQMELLGVIEGLKALKEPCRVKIYSDSSYVVKAINEWLEKWQKSNFKGKKNVELWKEFLEVAKPHEIEAIWVKGHDGHKENEMCDKLARDEAQKLKDEKLKES
jgi:ribonuclease HI